MAITAPPSGSIASLLADRPMSRPQIWAVTLSVALNALDGFDVLAITFAAPGISQDWGIGPAQLGIALSSGLVGMAAGSLLLAPFGDRFGRRPLILGCLVLMTLGMALTATADGIYSLCVWRVLTGLGIGGSALGWAAPRFGLMRLVVLAMIGTAATFAVFGMVYGLVALQAVAFVAGMCVFGGIVGLYALLARSFPPELRVTGTGLAIGIGRGGAIVGPLIGGFLIAGGTSIPLAIAIVGSGALIGAALLAILARGPAEPPVSDG
ncbi:MFS transporter [Sphingomonas arantia]|uniref:MFS transporter n=1 Tax=Sphingomonas arantia TaxID=1460676 RepID=A0ABW4TTK5_9SPHN